MKKFPMKFFGRQIARVDEGHALIALAGLWAAYVVGAILLLPIGNPTVFGLLVPAAGLVLLGISVVAFPASRLRWTAWNVDGEDLVAIGVIYAVVVGLFKIAFGVFGTGQTLGLFLSFAGGMLVGVLGAVFYTVWMRGRSLESLGFTGQRLGGTLLLAVLFAVAQFAVTLVGYSYPQPVDWVPLLVMSLTVGFFEAVFFRGFIQGTLERSFGVAPSVALAAGLYALYHIGYGMTGPEMLFLFGLGVIYTVAFRIPRNLLAIWPLLTPMGAFFNQLQSGQLAGQLPWMSIMGFIDILAVMAAGLWLALRHLRRAERQHHRASIPAAS